MLAAIEKDDFHEDVVSWNPELNISDIKKSILGINGNFIVPEMPKIINDLNLLINQPFPNVRNITNLIEENSVVTGDILSVINSVTFQKSMTNPVEIQTIRHFVTLFGIDKLYQITLSSAFKGVKYSNPVIDSIIASSAFLAKTCSIIARFVPNVSVQTAYFYGLFVHSGMIVLAMQEEKLKNNKNESNNHQNSYATIFEKSTCNPSVSIPLEMAQYNGSRHDHLGVAVARKWGVGLHPNNPALHREDVAILLAIQEHHHPKFYAIENDIVRNLIAIHHLADQFLVEFVHSKKCPKPNQEMKAHVVALLGLDGDMLQDISLAVGESLFS